MLKVIINPEVDPEKLVRLARGVMPNRIVNGTQSRVWRGQEVDTLGGRCSRPSGLRADLEACTRSTFTRAIFIRHGQSTGNAGFPCQDLALLELTEKGRKQAREAAMTWTAAPDLIVTSPYRRTKQTAQPTVERFPGIPVDEWPIQEFTYLEPTRWNGTLSAERKPHIDAYWEAADPEYRDGPGAESFSDLLGRASDALQRLAALPPASRALIFSHGQFIHAVRVLVLWPDCSNRERMLRFWRKDGTSSVQNCEQVEIVRIEHAWKLS